METRLKLDILAQPNDVTCGPTCLHALYNYYDDEVPLNDLIAQTPQLKGGGTFAVFLACHAMKRGYTASIYSYNLRVFDPTWFDLPPETIIDRLQAQYEHKGGRRLGLITRGYIEFLSRGGALRFQDLTAGLIRRYLRRGLPILTGLSATHLYRTPREYGPNDDYDDVRGKPSGHFVVLCGYDPDTRNVLVADPMHPNPISSSQYYEISIDRVIGAILLGILTHDANLLIIEPPRRWKHDHARPQEPGHRQ
jgi:hypothetical protein